MCFLLYGFSFAAVHSFLMPGETKNKIMAGEEKMKMTNEEYKKYAESHSPRSNSRANFIKSFLSAQTSKRI